MSLVASLASSLMPSYARVALPDVDLKRELGIDDEQAAAIAQMLREPRSPAAEMFVEIVYGMLFAELAAIGRNR